MLKLQLKDLGRLKMLKPRNYPAESKAGALLDMLIDAAIVGGITLVSTLIVAGPAASMQAAVLAGAMAFLVKLRELRGIKETRKE